MLETFENIDYITFSIINSKLKEFIILVILSVLFFCLLEEKI